MFKTTCIIWVSCSTSRDSLEEQSFTFLSRQLESLRYEVGQKTILCEKQNEIVDEIDRLSKHFDVVIVVTNLTNVALKALANLGNEEDNMKKHSCELCSGYEVPFSVKFLHGDHVKFPVPYFTRIFILKEDLLEQHFNILKPYLQQYRQEVDYKIIIQAQLNGNSKSVLDKINNCRILTEKYDKYVKFTLANSDLETIVAEQEMIKESLCDRGIQVYGGSEIFNSIFEAKEDCIHQAISSIKECLAKYGPQNVYLSFNGGKDCTVLLHLTYMVMKAEYPNYNCPIFCLYVKGTSSFDEQDKFIDQCRIFYNLDILEVTLGIKEALSMVSAKKPNLEACLMGTRRTDPYSKCLNVFQMTDPDWPKVMRVSPLLDWTYCDIWDYLLFYKVPYCKLYDQGYTSLGNPSNTIRNPHLSYKDVVTQKDSYLPAYKLLDKSKERDGRNVKGF